MTATPTPGDLSARHVEVLRRFLRMNNALLYSGEREALDAAIAALSALPAAGGRLNYFDVQKHCTELGIDYNKACEFARRILYITPQPSAAEGRCTQYRPGAPCPVPDSCRENGCSAVERELFSDVGAQGEGKRYTQADLNAEYTRGRCDGFDAATPAAGKGVDEPFLRAPLPVPADIMEARAQGRAEALAIVLGLEAETGLDDYVDSVPPGPAGEWGTAWNETKLRELFHADDSAWSLLQAAEGEYWHNLGLREEAALTRQPVAGDGWIDRAARAAAEIGERLGQLTPQRDTGLELHHLKWMADELAAKRVGSETKCCRWLGWLQAGMVFHGLSTLEEEKQRNLRSAPTGPAQGDGEVEGG